MRIPRPPLIIAACLSLALPALAHAQSLDIGVELGGLSTDVSVGIDSSGGVPPPALGESTDALSTLSPGGSSELDREEAIRAVAAARALP